MSVLDCCLLLLSRLDRHDSTFLRLARSRKEVAEFRSLLGDVQDKQARWSEEALSEAVAEVAELCWGEEPGRMDCLPEEFRDAWNAVRTALIDGDAETVIALANL